MKRKEDKRLGNFSELCIIITFISNGQSWPFFGSIMPAEGMTHGAQASDVSYEHSSAPPNNQWTSVLLVFEGLVERLEKDQDRTGPRPIKTGNSQDWSRP